MLAQFLDKWSESLEAAASRLLGELEAAASRLLRKVEEAASRLRELEAAASRLREQADRPMTALSTAGLVLSAGDADRLVVPRIDAAQPAALAYTAPRAAAARKVMTPALQSARATLSPGVDRARSELDARRAEKAAPATACIHNAGKADKRARKKTGQKHRQYEKEAVPTARTVKGEAGAKPKHRRSLAA